MKKIILTALFISVLSIQAFCEDNIGRYIYSIFSENFNGVKIDLSLWKGQSDREEIPDLTSLDSAMAGEYAYSALKPVVHTLIYGDNDIKIDGNKYWHIVSTNASFPTGTSLSYVSYSKFVDLSAYAGGSIEFYARSGNGVANAAAENFEVGMTSKKWATSESTEDWNRNDKTTRIGNYGFVGDGEWHKVSIPLSVFAAVNDFQGINAVWNVWLFSAKGVSATIDIDCIVWKKALGGSLDVNVKNVSDDSPATGITWSTSAIYGSWVAAQQYLELELDILPDNNYQWGVQIYTDNTSAAASPRYTGTMVSSMASGLVSSDTTKMLPMAWRSTDKVLEYSGKYKIDPLLYPDDFDKTLIIKANDGGIYDGGSDDPGTAGFYCWFAMKDKAQFSLGDPDVTSRADYLRMWDNRGFHAAPGPFEYYGMSPGSMVNMKIAPKIYLAANFATAYVPNTYETNAIIIELFYE